MSQNTAGQAERPNIIVIMVDDMGFSDIGCFGSEIRTPNLDRLAQNGATYTQAYNCARCCPTRASLLTGLYPHRAGVGAMVTPLGRPGYLGHLNENCLTIAEALKTGGYYTFLSGKWHVGGYYSGDPKTWNAGAPDHPIPIQRGFDDHFGTLAGAGSYFNPHTLIEQDRFVDIQADQEFYYTDAIADHSLRCIDRAERQKQPFFGYVAFTAPHWPLHAHPEDIARYDSIYACGWDELRGRRYEALQATNIIRSTWQNAPRHRDAPPWEDIDEPQWRAWCMAVYAAQIDRMDQTVGRIITKLQQSDQLDNTLIMFLSDNGGCAEFLHEDGFVRDVVRSRTPRGDHVHVGNHTGVMPGPDTTYMSYELPWANASNTPFRMFKQWVHEGGISTPLLMHWPDRIRRGLRRNDIVHVIDIMPTCLDAAGVSYPDQYEGIERKSLDGISLMPSMTNQVAEDTQRVLGFEHIGAQAMRIGDWKLVCEQHSPWELYNVAEDRTELDNHAEREPQRKAEMIEAYEHWATQNDVVPRRQLDEEIASRSNTK